MIPVIVGGTLAWAVEGQLYWPALLAALFGGALQLGINLHNDATGSRRGGDGPDRFGPLRATASGLLDQATVNASALACFAGAALIGCYLVWVGGWTIFLLGVAAIVSGWAYNGGPLPIAYTPFGELFVVVFLVKARCAVLIGFALAISMRPPLMPVWPWGFLLQRFCWSTINAMSKLMHGSGGELSLFWPVPI